MKRIAASVGLVALGTSVLQATDAGALTSMQTAKPWSASLSLRGFYDDNINSTKDDKTDSLGFEINPSVGIGFATDQTSGRFGYTYSGKYYGTKPSGNSSNWDHTHIFDAALQHAFSSRARLAVTDSFVIGQEPDVLRVDNVMVAPQRISGDNIRNHGTIVFNYQVTELLGLEVGYANSWYNYDDNGDVVVLAPLPEVAATSRSGVLDRIEHSAFLNTRWQLAPQTVGIVGYMYGETDYTGDEFVQGDLNVLVPFSKSDDRNSRSHFGYVGVEHSFNPQLSGTARVGFQYIDFYNDGSTSVTPYGEGTIRYFYGPENRVEGGVTYRRATTDYVGETSVVDDAGTLVVYGSVTHRIMPRVYGSLIGTYQWQRFNGGGAGSDGENEHFYLLGADLSYRFNAHLSAHVGYNLDVLDSDISDRDYDRNRVYVGVTADY